MIIVGIDTGLNGAIAIYLPDTHIITEICDMPKMSITVGKKAREILDITQLKKIMESVCHLTSIGRNLIVYERVWGQGGQNAAAGFNFGVNYGTVLAYLAVFAQCELHPVIPQTWKKSLKVGVSDNDIANRADSIFPKESWRWRGPRGGLKDGRAEAAMLAYYGRTITDGKKV